MFGKSRSYIVAPATVGFPASGVSLTVDSLDRGLQISALGSNNSLLQFNGNAVNRFSIGWGTGTSQFIIFDDANSAYRQTLSTSGNFTWNTPSSGGHTINGALAVPTSPLAAATTQSITGLAGFRSSDNTSTNSTLTADAQLTLTFNETGNFALEIWLAFWEATSGAGGFQFDLNSGTSTVNKINYGVQGWSTAAVSFVGATTVSTATSMATIVTTVASPSWMLAKGWVNITGTGTRAVRWAQASTSANTTTLLQGSYFMATKIG